MRFRPSKIRRSHRDGSTLVLVAVFIVALFAFAALSIDVGNVYVQRARIQEAGDAASMASVVDWATGSTADAVTTEARSFVQANGVSTNEVKTVRCGIWNQATRTFTEQATFTASQVPAVEVTNQRVVPLPFARAVGLSSMSPKTVSVAVAAHANGVINALPWGACSNSVNFVPSKCDVVTVKNGNDCASSGNFGALALGGSGASVYRDNIVTGYPGVLHVGDTASTEPGNMVGPTKQGLNDRLNGVPPYTCSANSPPPTGARLGVIPIISDMPKNGSGDVQILGFYTVALIDSSGSGQVTVEFVEVFSGTEVDPSKPPVFGQVNGVALVQ
jgi:Flp pilus assembly protein TadG